MISYAVKRRVSGLRPSRLLNRRFSLDETCAQAEDDVRLWHSGPQRQIVRSLQPRGSQFQHAR